MKLVVEHSLNMHVTFDL